jgi:hypothetical protein
VRYSPRGNELSTGGVRGIHRWPIRSASDGPDRLRIGPPRQILRDPVKQLVVTPDDRSLAAAVADRGGLILRMGEAVARGPWLSHDGAVFAAISPDGRWAATSTWHGRGVVVWDARSGRPVARLLPKAISITVAFSPDGDWLVTGTPHEFCFWSIGTWQPRRRLPRVGADLPSHTAFSPDGGIAALETAPARILLLDPATGQELATLEDPDMHRASHLAFSPDGSLLVVISGVARLIQLWDLRRLRSELAELGLDWDGRRPPVAPGGDKEPMLYRLQVELDAELYAARAARHMRLGAFDRAVSDYEAALKQDPELATACNDLAWIRATGPPQLRNADQAIQLARRAITPQRKNPAFLNTIGVVHYRAGRWQDAVAALQAAIDAHAPDEGTAWDYFFLAMAHHRLGYAARARTDFDLAVRWWDGHNVLTPQEITELSAFRSEAEALLSGRGGELPADVFAHQ